VPGGEFGTACCRSLQSQITEKSLAFTLPDATPPGQPALALVKYRNVRRAYCRIVKDTQTLPYGRSRSYDDNRLWQLCALTPVSQWKVSLPDDGDFQQHSVEIALPALAAGYYAVLLSDDTSFVTEGHAVVYASLRVSGLACLNRTNEKGDIECSVLDRASGAPIAKAPIQVRVSTWSWTTHTMLGVRAATLVTDAEGRVSFGRKSDWPSPFLIINNGNDTLFTDYLTGGYGGAPRDEAQVQTVFFTDRAIYRPGQIIYFKGLVMQRRGNSAKVMPSTTSMVTLLDVNYQKVDSVRLTTSEFGTFNGSFRAPQGMLNGRMTIHEVHGSSSVMVEEYKRPRFAVVLDTLQQEVTLGDTVAVRGSARLYAGATVGKATVAYRVVRQPVYPPWIYWCWWLIPEAPQTEIASGSVSSDDDGTFRFTFPAPADRKATVAPDLRFRFVVTVDVTDANGETRSARKELTIGATAIQLGLVLPAQIERSRDSVCVVQAVSCEGRNVPLRGVVSLFRLRQPGALLHERLWEQPDRQVMSRTDFTTQFAHDPFGSEYDMTTWERGAAVARIDFDTRADTTVTLPRDMAPGPYLLEAVAKDRLGREVKSVTYVTLFDRTAARPPVQVYDWYAPLATTCEPGDTAKVLIGSGAPGVRVLFEVEANASIVQQRWITLDNSQQILAYPVTETQRGSLAFHIAYIKDNRAYERTIPIEVPFSNKELTCTWATFRDQLEPGQKEEWRLTIAGKQGDKVAAEVVAGLYDASLDAFARHTWELALYAQGTPRSGWSGDVSFGVGEAHDVASNWNESVPMPTRQYDELNLFGHYLSIGRRGSARIGYGAGYGLGFGGGSGGVDALIGSLMGDEEGASISVKSRGARAMMAAAPAPQLMMIADAGSRYENAAPAEAESQPSANDDAALSSVTARTNLNETAFFFPQLRTDPQGNVAIAFTMPEALTRWNFVALAHTTDLRIGQLRAAAVTRKELMVIPAMPRFMREGDTITVCATIANTADRDLSGSARLTLVDAITGTSIDSIIRTKGDLPFTAAKGANANVNWTICVPRGLQALTWRVVAKSGSFSDGEEAALPVLSNRMLVTETMPLPLRGKQTKEFTFAKLCAADSSKTLRHERLTLEYSPNPAWYAIQALPYLMEYPYECAEQTFSRFYANSIATTIANSNPRISQVFDKWRNATPDALLSNLQKNQELKALLLEETPWVLAGQSEAQRKQNVGILFDLSRMSREQRGALAKLQSQQSQSGGWPWFSGMPDSRYITQYIVMGIAQLDKLGVRSADDSRRYRDMVERAVRYCDNQMREDYAALLRHPATLKDNNLSALHIQYLYSRTAFIKEFPLAPECQPAFDYFHSQAKTWWLQNNRCLQGMIAIALHRLDDMQRSLTIIKSLGENAIRSEERGMYWNDIVAGYSWYQAPVETMALLAEAFDEVGHDSASVEAIKVWLLKNKQTTDWKTTRATAQACFALLMRGTAILSQPAAFDIKVGRHELTPATQAKSMEAGSGYFKTSWSGSEITPAMGKVVVRKTDDGVAWGALYWQYFEQLDRITSHASPLRISTKLFVERGSARGPVIEPVSPTATLKVGDKVIVRIELRTDRELEYIHLKDMRAAGFEPINVFSGYRWQDGLGYYETTKDASTSFFIEHLPTGTFVFEYPLRVAQAGSFSNGITTAQCMYAPEFAAHSEGIRVHTKR
jgi:hypothetical protein